MDKKLIPVILGAVALLVISNMIVFNWASQQNGEDGMPDAMDGVFTGDEEMDDFDLLYDVVNILDEEYIEEIEKGKLLEGAIDGLLRTLDDPQTTFLDMDAMDDFDEFIIGSFGGVGIQVIESEDGLTVIDVLPGTPAEEAEMQRGDRVHYVEDEDIREMEMDQAVDLIRGEIGSEVTLSVQRPGAEDLMEFTLVRQEVSAPTVNTEWLNSDLGYIEITQFDGNTGEEFQENLWEMEEEGMEGLVLDLRGNPGGILNEALDVARLLVPEGEIVRIVDRHDEVRDVYKSQAEPRPYPMVVLIDEQSASGSEIIAGALQERADASLVGQPTFGKATVQEIERFDGGTGMRYTVARYETPEGVDLHGEGLTPDYELELPSFVQYYYHFIPGEMGEGEYGKTVELLQEMLASLDYDVEPTGYFGEETAEALRSFQEDNDLSADGKFDDITWVNLRDALEEVMHEEDQQLQKALELLQE